MASASAKVNTKNSLPKSLHYKNLLWWLLAFALFSFGVERLINAKNALSNKGIVGVEHSVVFTGEGKVKIVPDTARIDLGLITEGKESVAVQNENAEKMNKVIAYLRSQGVAAQDIKTSQYNLSPKYDYVKGKTTLSGYVLSQVLTVTVRDLQKIGDLLDGAVKNGANQVNSVSLFVDKPEELRAKARAEAAANAREKAQASAKIAGFKLGRLIGFTENQAHDRPIFFESKGMGSAESVLAPQIEPGTQEISVSVTLTYLIR